MQKRNKSKTFKVGQLVTADFECTYMLTYSRARLLWSLQYKILQRRYRRCYFDNRCAGFFLRWRICDDSNTSRKRVGYI